MTVPSKRNISAKELKYNDLEIEISRTWQLKIKTIFDVVGAVGMIKKSSDKCFDQITGKPVIYETQKIALISTTHILKEFLSI